MARGPLQPAYPPPSGSPRRRAGERGLRRPAAGGQVGPRPGFRERFKVLRVALLLTVLTAVVLWGVKVESRRRARNQWRRTIPVEVVLLRHGYVAPATQQALVAGMQRLEGLMAAELARFRPAAPPPFSFVPVGAASVSEPPPEPPESTRLWHRAAHYLRLWRYLDRAHRRGGLRSRGDTLRLYVVLEPPRNRTRYVEGFGGGDIGVVRAALDRTNIDQALLAMGHELLHCLGASDKYDDEGHALEPDGLPEPARAPTYPQRYAEIMVGEVALDRRKGRLVDSLAEVRVGPVTASEIGWLAH